MAAVKNVGVNAVEAIVKEREQNGPFRGVYDFARDVYKRQLQDGLAQ